MGFWGLGFGVLGFEFTVGDSKPQAYGRWWSEPISSVAVVAAGKSVFVVVVLALLVAVCSVDSRVMVPTVFSFSRHDKPLQT